MNSTSRPSSNSSWASAPGPAALSASIDTGLWRCEVRSTAAENGDFQVRDPQLDVEGRRLAIVDSPWTWLRQTHSADIVQVASPGEHAGAQADGAVTQVSMAPIAVTTADCCPVVLVGTTGVAVVHAGWRGALAGIVEKAASSLHDLGAAPVATLLGPCIGPLDYEFGEAELDQLEASHGPSVRSVTRSGKPALNMTAVVASACDAAGWPEPASAGCTSNPTFFSHRTRQDAGRQTTVAWLTERSQNE